MPDPAAVIRRAQQRYWRRNVTVMIFLLGLWAFVGLGCGILFADVLNDMAAIGGVPLGFWFAQQGSIIVFVLIILVYAITMNRLDDRYHRETQDAKAALKNPSHAPKPTVSDREADTPNAPEQAPEGGDA